MSVAGNDLDEAILARNERFLVDPDCVGLPEAVLAALRQETFRARELFVDLLVLVAGGGAVDDDRRPFERLHRVVGNLVAERLEVGDRVRVDGEGAAPAFRRG